MGAILWGESSRYETGSLKAANLLNARRVVSDGGRQASHGRLGVEARRGDRPATRLHGRFRLHIHWLSFRFPFAGR